MPREKNAMGTTPTRQQRRPRHRKKTDTRETEQKKDRRTKNKELQNKPEHDGSTKARGPWLLQLLMFKRTQ